MKKFDIFKTIQLIIFVLLTGIALYIIFTDHELYRLIASNPHIRVLCILLWAACGISFLFIFLDFTLYSTLKKDYKELDYAVSHMKQRKTLFFQRIVIRAGHIYYFLKKL